MNYPSKMWVAHTLRYNAYASRRVVIKAAYIVGSEAKGTAGVHSDLDIAIVIPNVRGKTSAKYTEQFHEKFPSNDVMPQWEGRRVDFQFFYEDDQELVDYAKIELS